METQSNPLSAVVTELRAIKYFGKYAILHRVVGGLVVHQVLVKIKNFNETLAQPWAIKTTGGIYRNVQSQFPGQDLYLIPVPFENPLAKVNSARAGRAFKGQVVFMWEHGWNPEERHDQKLVISDCCARFDNTRHPWWCGTITRPNERTWYAQATNMFGAYYIVPAAAFGPKEAKTPAESLSRIFLGG